jgi:hypothetical protein
MKITFLLTHALVYKDTTFIGIHIQKHTQKERKKERERERVILAAVCGGADLKRNINPTLVRKSSCKTKIESSVWNPTDSLL